MGVGGGGGGGGEDGWVCLCSPTVNVTALRSKNRLVRCGFLPNRFKFGNQ